MVQCRMKKKAPDIRYGIRVTCDFVLIFIFLIVKFDLIPRLPINLAKLGSTEQERGARGDPWYWAVPNKLRPGWNPPYLPCSKPPG
jgi:hypothetical protein